MAQHRHTQRQTRHHLPSRHSPLRNPDLATPTRKHALADQAAELLHGRIRSGEWPLRAKLSGETTLGPQLGVGRSTVRKAIGQLVGKGVLQTRQGVGVFATALDVNDDWEVVLRRANIISATEARIAIESEAASLGAKRRTPQDLLTIHRALEQRARRTESKEEYVDADMQFHRAVVVASNNTVLLELFDSFVPRLRQSMVEVLRLSAPLDSETDHGAHLALVEAIATQDSTSAAESSHAHLESLKAALTVHQVGSDTALISPAPCH